MSSLAAMERSTLQGISLAGTSATSKLVIVYLATQRSATTDQMKRELALPKLTLLSVLDRLEEMKAITHSDGVYSVTRSESGGDERSK